MIKRILLIWFPATFALAGIFGLRHLPADIFYAGVWNAAPRMWLARQADLYPGAVLLGLARYYGKSTYASAVMHACAFALIFVQGFIYLYTGIRRRIIGCSAGAPGGPAYNTEKTR